MMEERGIVYLVGAGPGDPELMTVRGLKCLRRADVVIYDRLLDPALLDEAPPWAERIFAGKAPGNHTLRQEEINVLLVDRARSGHVVVRLKGGDPFVFGRGGEEALACARAGVRWEVIPGVSSAISVPANAAIPVTHRGIARSFAVVTAQPSGECEEPDWAALASIDTLVVLMGVAQLPRLSERLVYYGRSPATPAAIIESGTLPGERVVTGTLGELAVHAAREGIRSPATIVIGEVVRLRELLLGTLPVTAGVTGEAPGWLLDAAC
jgi:uroporphyrin-III C-methyltransferase